MARDDDWMGQIAAQDAYDNTERDFQHGIRQTPWFSEFVQRYGEEPDLNTKDYDTRGAWAAGIRPVQRDPNDGLLHWDSRFKSDTHPNRFIDGVDTKTGNPPVQDAFEAFANRTRRSVQPPEGRREAPGQILGPVTDALVLNPLRKGQGLLQRAVDANAEMFPAQSGITSVSTDYDPRREAADYAAGTAFNVVTGGMGLAPEGVLGSSGGKLRGAKPAKETGFAPGSIAEDATAVIDPKLRAKAEALRGTYPQYAHEYPPIGPPALRAKTPDPDKPGSYLATPLKGEIPYANMEEALTKDAEPGFFLQKKLLPEVAKFQKDRAIIQQDMDLHGYKPYFDPNKRFDVDPKHYGPFKDTGVEAAPATAKTDAEWYAKYGTPENRAKLQVGYEKGKTIPESDRWYLMGQLEQKYIAELGPEKGRAAFKREFGDMMAATTGGAAPYDNWLMSQYANVTAKKGERLAERAYELPFPIGGRYASGNIEQAQKYIDEGMKGFDPAVNPKRYDFSSAFQGNKNASTIDEQMYQALRPTTTKASVNLPEWYGPATRVAREEAKKAGATDARAFQDVGWAGLKSNKVEAKGDKFEYEGPMINQINRSIETTHRLTGMPVEDVVRLGVILKKIPMYAVPGLIGAGAASKMGGVAAQDRYEQ